MKYRKVRIFTGESFNVPAHIVRLDSRKTHGWQIRYGDSTIEAFFPDGSNDGTGAAAALDKATRALVKRVKSMQAPTGLKKDVLAWKVSKLPLGISGPAERYRAGKKVKQFYFQVTVPRFGEKPRNASVYIATENTISKEKYNTALGKAIGMRQEAERKYQREATRAMRAQHTEET
jgi:hypothetical protein